MTFGGTPYPSLGHIEKLFDFLRAGHRMEKPDICSDELYVRLYRSFFLRERCIHIDFIDLIRFPRQVRGDARLLARQLLSSSLFLPVGTPTRHPAEEDVWRFKVLGTQPINEFVPRGSLSTRKDTSSRRRRRSCESTVADAGFRTAGILHENFLRLLFPSECFPQSFHSHRIMLIMKTIFPKSTMCMMEK